MAIPEGTQEIHEILSQDTWSMCQNMNLRPPSYEVGVPSTLSQYSLMNLIFL
jgi:hypothetical protein